MSYSLPLSLTKGDGHDYVHEAARGGAAGVLSQRPFDLAAQGATCVLVEDSSQGLRDWAQYILRKLGPRVVGVTGSTGKTTTKELIAAVLSQRYGTYRNTGSYNNRYGLGNFAWKAEA